MNVEPSENGENNSGPLVSLVGRAVLPVRLLLRFGQLAHYLFGCVFLHALCILCIVVHRA